MLRILVSLIMEIFRFFCIENSNVDKIKDSIKQNYNNIVPKHRKYIKQLLTYI